MGTPRHGHAKLGNHSPTYRSWESMRTRCLGVWSTTYSYYGGRGIAICARWMRFENFLEDMGERPPKTSIDRIDNNAHYSCGHCEQCQSNGWKANCQWATRSQQAQNSRQVVLIEFNGESRCLAEWARVLGMNRYTLHSRLFKAGWPVEKAMTTPAGSYTKKAERK